MLTLFDYIKHIFLNSQSLGCTDEGGLEITSLCVSNLLRGDHTEELSAAVPEPVSPSAVQGTEVCLSHLKEKKECRFLMLQIHMDFVLRYLVICLYQQSTDGDGGVQTCSFESLSPHTNTVEQTVKMLTVDLTVIYC